MRFRKRLGVGPSRATTAALTAVAAATPIAACSSGSSGSSSSGTTSTTFPAPRTAPRHQVTAVRGALPTPLPDGRYSARPAKAQLSRQMPEAREGDPRNRRADACESVQITSNYMANLGQDAPRQRAFNKGQFRI